MATKLESYIQMAGRTANEITKNRENWTAFLDTVSKLYRYSFTDLLLIHAQRPQATACAEFDLWNKRMRRYIRRGSKGIGLVQMNNGRPSLRYVFDVADTGKRKDARGFVLWHYKSEYSEAITKHLEEYFGVKNQNGISELFGLVTVKCAKEFWKKYGDDVISYYLLCSLEILDDNGKLQRKEQQQRLFHWVWGYATCGKSLRPTPYNAGSNRIWCYAGVYGENPTNSKFAAYGTGRLLQAHGQRVRACAPYPGAI